MINKALLRTTMQLVEEGSMFAQGHYARMKVGQLGSERYCFATLMVLNVHPDASIRWFGNPEGADRWAYEIDLADGSRHGISVLADQLAGLADVDHRLYRAVNTVADLRTMVDTLTAR